MKTLTLLNKGKEIHVVVDSADYEDVSRYKWHLAHNGDAMRWTPRGSVRRISMQRHILGMSAEDSRLAHNKNGDRLDNRRENLSTRSMSYACHDRGMNSNNTSGYKGVSLVRATKKWRAVIRVDNKSHHLGTFSSPENAHQAYCAAAKRFFGEFANGG